MGPHGDRPRRAFPQDPSSGYGRCRRPLGTDSRSAGEPRPRTADGFRGILESFVVGEVLKQVSWAEEPLEVGHFRTHDGVEADIAIEGSDARIAAIEVKASSQVQPTDLRGLRLLRDRFPDRFVGGTVLYLGPLAYTAEDRIHVVPLDRLWM